MGITFVLFEVDVVDTDGIQGQFHTLLILEIMDYFEELFEIMNGLLILSVVVKKNSLSEVIS